MNKKTMIIVTIITVVFLTLSFLAVRQNVIRAKNESFEKTYRFSIENYGRQFLLAHTGLVDNIPKGVLQSNDTDRWKNIADLFQTYLQDIEKFYEPIAGCLKDGSCWPRDSEGEFCNKAALELLAYREVLRRLQLIQGINVSGGDDSFGGAFGVTFRIPAIGNLNKIADGPCVRKVKDAANIKPEQHRQRLEEARNAWRKILANNSIVEIRDFPVAFDVAFDVVSKSEFDEAVREASKDAKVKIQNLLCDLHREMLNGPGEFNREEKRFPNYLLSPTCRLEADESRKCTWNRLYSRANQLITGLGGRIADEDTQTAFLKEIIEHCIPSTCKVRKEASNSGQNDWGFTCKGLDREYDCSKEPSVIIVSVITCFDSSALQIATPPPPKLHNEPVVVTDSIKDAADGYRLCQGKISLKSCLTQTRAILCKAPPGIMADVNCGRNVFAKIENSALHCLETASDDLNAKYLNGELSLGDGWSIAISSTGAKISVQRSLTSVFALEFDVVGGFEEYLGKVQMRTWGTGNHILIDGHRFDVTLGWEDVAAMLRGTQIQVPDLDNKSLYETSPLSKFRELYGQLSKTFNGCGFPLPAL